MGLKSNPIDNLSVQAKEYLDAKIDEAKLKGTKGLSQALGLLVSLLLIIAVAFVILVTLSFAMLDVLKDCVGSPWHIVIVCGVFLCILIALVALRKKLFRNTFVKIFIDVFYPKEDEKK